MLEVPDLDPTSAVLSVAALRLVAAILVLVSCGAPRLEAAPGSGGFVDAAQDPGCSNLAEWTAEVVRLEAAARSFVDSSSAEALEAGIERKRSDVILVTLLWPRLLEGKIPYFRMYEDLRGAASRALERPQPRVAPRLGGLCGARISAQSGAGDLSPARVLLRGVREHQAR